MSFLSTTHASFICPSQSSSKRHPQIANAVLGRKQRQAFGAFYHPPPCLMASVACQDGTVEVPRTHIAENADDSTNITTSTKVDNSTQMLSMSYRVFRPMSLASQQAAPILVLHGGPSVPSDYLYPLVDHISYRSIVFYDQIGCGRSSIPGDINSYSISQSIDDLEILIKKLNLRRFHLYGQSFGGILAFEYLKRVAERKDNRGYECLSAILSSAPTNVKQVEGEAQRLLDTIKSESKDDSDYDSDDNESNDVGEKFRQRHQCRTDELPEPLVQAYAGAGTVWRGTSAIPDYVASPPADGAKRMPSAMVISGEHDFVTSDCVEGWKTVFNHKFVRQKILEGCGHHGLLERGSMYGEIVDSYFHEYD